MRLLILAILLLIKINSSSQTIVRGDRKVVYSERGLTITEIKWHHLPNDFQILSNALSGKPVPSGKNQPLDSTFFTWSWTYNEPGHIDSWGNGPIAGVYETSFNTSGTEESLSLLLKCIQVLEMEVNLGSHDWIYDNIGSVNLLRTGSNPNIVTLSSKSQQEPLTGLPFAYKSLHLTKSDCINLVRAIKEHKSILDN